MGWHSQGRVYGVCRASVETTDGQGTIAVKSFTFVTGSRWLGPVLSAFHTSSHAMLPSSLWGGKYDQPHFPQEDTEA